MKTSNKFGIYSLLAVLFTGTILTSCSSNDDVPPEENEEEVNFKSKIK